MPSLYQAKLALIIILLQNADPRSDSQLWGRIHPIVVNVSFDIIVFLVNVP